MLKKINTSFLKQNEIIMMILHRHWIILLYKFLYILVLITTTIIIFAMENAIVSVIGDGLYWVLTTLYWIVFLIFIFLSWVNDELDLFVITNERIIGIEQVSALSRSVTECSLDRVQEVNSQVSGIFPTLFGYGEVHIHTASEFSNMLVKYAPNPVENVRKINTIIQELRRQKSNEL